MQLSRQHSVLSNPRNAAFRRIHVSYGFIVTLDIAVDAECSNQCDRQNNLGTMQILQTRRLRLGRKDTLESRPVEMVSCALRCSPNVSRVRNVHAASLRATESYGPFVHIYTHLRIKACQKIRLRHAISGRRVATSDALLSFDATNHFAASEIWTNMCPVRLTFMTFRHLQSCGTLSSPSVSSYVTCTTFKSFPPAVWRAME